jgi:hypothetical protein
MACGSGEGDNSHDSTLLRNAFAQSRCGHSTDSRTSWPCFTIDHSDLHESCGQSAFQRVSEMSSEEVTMKKQSRGRPRTQTKLEDRIESSPKPLLDDQVFMLPWYLPKDIYLAVRRLLPNIHISKMRYYFDDYGCLRCERQNVLYETNGLCEQCNVIVRGRLANCLKRRLKQVGMLDDHLVPSDGELTLARALLQPLNIRKSRRSLRANNTT